MFKRYLCAFSGWLVVSASFAAETDQFTTWEKGLLDSLGQANSYMNQSLQDIAESANSKKKIWSCEKVQDELHKNLRKHFVLFLSFEKKNPRGQTFWVSSLLLEYFRL